MSQAARLDARSFLRIAKRKKRSRDIGYTLLRQTSILLFFLFWFAATWLNNNVIRLYNPILIPTPGQVLAVGVEMWQSGELIQDIAASMYRVVVGFVVASSAGVGLGVLLSRSRLAESLLEPVIEMFRPVPSLAFLPLLVLWFGIGETSKVVFIAYATFFPVFTATRLGMRQIDPVLIRAAQSLGASRAAIFRRVELPAASPSIFTGLRMGFGLAFFVIVAAEYIAANSGLGYLINNSRTYFDVSRMLLGAIVIGILGFLINVGLVRLERRLLRWQPADRS